MRLNKKITEGIVLMILALVLVGSGISSAIAKEPVGKTVEKTETLAVAKDAKAGIIASLASEESRMMDRVEEEQATLEKTINPVSVTTEKTEEKTEEKKPSKTELEWQDKVMADVSDFLSIRKKGSTDAKMLGKLYPTSVATVVKEGKEWTKIKSGKVTGYVYNEYLLYGMDAYKHAKKVCKKYAFAETDGLRIRAEADEEAKVLATVDKGDKMRFDADAKKVDGWVAVKVKAGKGYVSSEYVTVKLNTTTAKTIKEELEELKKAGKHDPINVSDEDYQLMAAIIYCEAGCEPYEGQVAVGAVVLNRVRSSNFPDTIEGVIYQRGQFGPARNGSLSRALADPSRIPDSCYRAATEALAGADPTNGKLYFHGVGSRSGQVIGTHVFFSHF